MLLKRIWTVPLLESMGPVCAMAWNTERNSDAGSDKACKGGMTVGTVSIYQSVMDKKIDVEYRQRPVNLAIK